MKDRHVSDIIIFMEENLIADRIRIVLVDSQDGANIGSVCRAMKTMGLSRLALVTNREYDDNRVRTLALHASDIWENRKEFKTLDEALEGSALTVAATRRKGKFRKMSCASPEQLVSMISTMGDGMVSIVFGRESDGLTDAEVNKCSMVVTIPTSDSFPSLNLAQAVQIICYCIYKGLKPYSSDKILATESTTIASVSRIIEEIGQTGFFKTEDERRMTAIFMKDMISRSAPTDRELQKIEKLFTKLSRIKVHKEAKQ